IRTTATTRPAPGIVATWQVRDNPPLRLFTVRVDLTNPAVHIRVCPSDLTSPRPAGWQTCLLPVSAIARREDLIVAVNGSFFAPLQYRLIGARRVPYFRGNPANACGWTISDGRLWSTFDNCPGWPALIVRRDGSVAMDVYADPPIDAVQMVSGCQWLVHHGEKTGDDVKPYPRTAVGLDASHHTLTLMVADGHRPGYSVGLTPAQMADLLVADGVTDAINLDSGGSSTLVMKLDNNWQLISRPSDGYELFIPISLERPVANALGIVEDSPPAAAQTRASR
ncbi:MAG TPA: phosphodiester glycosidase family protein, partial [Tepidisphaeraceae bacterium]|nr:phosphodiester glycosidase family protein [Tepidisphaeraceae bacterium]